MGKIFEALEKSKFEYIGVDEDNLVSHKAAGPKKTVAPSSTEGKPVSIDSKTIDKNIITLLRPYGIEAEQFKKLRTSILFPSTGKPPRTIMVTSAMPGEGKTFVAANLSVSIAQNIDRHVLLMDCDLRLPTIHTSFGLERSPGLSEYLSGEHALDTLFLKSAFDGLTILTGGGPVSNPSELLSSDQMSALLKNVKERYNDRYIVIDTTPPRLTAETAAIARQVDAILLVIKHGTTKREHVVDLIDMLGKDKIIGVVLNQFNRQVSRYSYGSYYGKQPNSDNKKR